MPDSREKRSKSTGRQRGLTLIEVVISVLLIGVLAAAGSGLVLDMMSLSSKSDADNLNHAAARAALLRVTREIRRANQSSFNVINTNQLSFSGEAGSASVRFDPAQSSLWLAPTGGGERLLLKGVQDFRFQCFIRTAGVLTADVCAPKPCLSSDASKSKDGISHIDLTVIVGGASQSTISLSTSVGVRNRLSCA